MTTFNQFSWNEEDLLACKNAYMQLLNEGFSSEELSELDFGNLDRISVEDELYNV